jgi:hypothetical protein
MITGGGISAISGTITFDDSSTKPGPITLTPKTGSGDGDSGAFTITIVNEYAKPITRIEFTNPDYPASTLSMAGITAVIDDDNDQIFTITEAIPSGSSKVFAFTFTSSSRDVARVGLVLWAEGLPSGWSDENGDFTIGGTYLGIYPGDKEGQVLQSNGKTKFLEYK